MITDVNGTIQEQRQFDAWGNVVKLTDGAGNPLTTFLILDRGYTGHEHLLRVGLINMNGRLYDPLLHRFLSPDDYVQDPTNTQNFNRYGYVMNNPLKYTDESGQFFHIIVGAVIGGVFNVAVEAIHGKIGSLKDGLVAFGIGGVAGGGAAATGGASFDWGRNPDGALNKLSNITAEDVMKLKDAGVSVQNIIEWRGLYENAINKVAGQSNITAKYRMELMKAIIKLW